MELETKKIRARDQFKEFLRRHFSKDYGQMTDWEKTVAGVRFYVAEVHNPLSWYISEDEIEDGITDGPNDLDCDFIHKDGNRVLILQFRYHKEGMQESPKQIEYFQNILKRICDSEYKKNYKLVDALAGVDFETDFFTLRYITFAKIAGQAQLQAEKVPFIPPQFPGLEDRVTFECFDESSFGEQLRIAYSSFKGVSDEPWELTAVKADGKRSQVIRLQSGDYRSCLLVVSAEQVVNLYKRFKDGLFTMNIRNYIGNTLTNKAIIDVARNQPDKFFFFNNGISCLATRLDQLEDRITASGLQVINGAQTVKSLYRASLHSGWKTGPQPMILVRISEVEKGYGEEGRFKNDIIRYNNTQNTIKFSDFRSNDPVQEDLACKFKNISRYGKQVQYLPKRTDRTNKGAEVIKLEEFAKIVYAFLVDPVSFSHNTSFLFDDSESGGYNHVFGDGKQTWPKMPESEFKLRSAIWWLGKAFGDKRQKDLEIIADPNERSALERKWFLLFVTRVLLERLQGPEEYRQYLQKQFKGEWELGEGSVGKWFAQIYEAAKQVVVYTYKEDAKEAKFNHRNWTKSSITTERLRNCAVSIPIVSLDIPKN